MDLWRSDDDKHEVSWTHGWRTKGSRRDAAWRRKKRVLWHVTNFSSHLSTPEKHPDSMVQVQQPLSLSLSLSSISPLQEKQLDSTLSEFPGTFLDILVVGAVKFRRGSGYWVLCPFIRTLLSWPITIGFRHLFYTTIATEHQKDVNAPPFFGWKSAMQLNNMMELTGFSIVS